MRFLFLLPPLFVFLSCKGEAPSSVRIPTSLRYERFDLPISSFLKDQLSAPDEGYIEALVDGETTEIHHPNGHLSSTAAGQSFDQVLASISISIPDRGELPPLLISATAPTKFATIRSVIRSAVEKGIYRILFLVKSDAKGTGIIPFEVPTTSEAMPKIEPYFIQIDETGKVFTGSGPSRSRMDDGPEDRDLEKLNSQLELYSAAAKACGCEVAPCQIYVHPEASYQGMIDLLSLVSKWGLKPNFTDMEPEPRPKPILPTPRKPTAPFRTQPLPLATPR
jgi:biopolymer transport protein ExbD